ncbi:MAG: LytTR family DNA-binding domain-containing protein [Flavobacteriaceae bacterium]
MIKAIALDDEELALEVVQAYCDQIDYIDLVQTFTGQDKAVKYLNKFNVDLLILDIQMPKLNGVDLYKSLKRQTKVIFTTAYSHYAVEGFNVNASDYLLKPFSPERFLTAVEKVKREMELENFSPEENTHLSIRADFKLYNIPFVSILMVEALDDYIQIYLEDGKKIVARFTMKAILQKLPPSQFKRVHRSFIVPLKKIKSVYKDSLQIEGFTVPMGNTYKADIMKEISKG